MSQDPFWDIFSKIYVISVTNSTRTEALKRNFAKARLTRYEILEFTPAEKTVNDASGNGKEDLSLFELLESDRCDETCQNIRSNHLAAIQKAADADAARVLLFEDDAEFEVPIDWARLREVSRWLRENLSSWDIFYLGCIPYPKPFMRPIGAHVVEIASPYLAHSYALNQKAIQYIVKHQKCFGNGGNGLRPFLASPSSPLLLGPKEGVHFRRCGKMDGLHMDALLARLPLRKVAIYPNLCFQSVDPAIYTKALEKLHLRIKMKDFTKFYEVLCLLFFPLVLIFFLLCASMSI